MEKKYVKMIDGALKGLKWDVVLAHYAAKDYKIKGEDGAIKKTQKKTAIRDEIKDIVSFMIESNMKQIEQDNWIIRWITGSADSKAKLEILFVPTKGLSSEEEDVDFDLEEEVKKPEKEVLLELLNKNEKEEKYELCAVIAKQLKKADKKKK